MENDLSQDYTYKEFRPKLIPTAIPSPTPTPSPTPIPIIGWILGHKILFGLLVLMVVFLFMMRNINFPKEIPGDYFVRLAEAAANLAKSAAGPMPSFDTSQLQSVSLSDLQSLPH